MSEKKLYIHVVEEDDQMNLTYKWKNMIFFARLISRLFTPLLDEVKSSLKELELRNKELEKQVADLSQKVSFLSEKTKALSAGFNTKQAGLYSNYKKAIDVFSDLNGKLGKNVRTFNEANKLSILQMLVNYLYNPTNELQKSIMDAACGNERTLSMLKDIDDFNANLKPDLVKYLDSIDKKWKDCVSFPVEDIYNPSTMQPYADEMEKGSPIYVVSLGYKFPKSNAEEQQPMVFVRKS
ncbi:hypothetical protein AAH145_04995 [Bacteroides thetaiotaomicron]|uniref:hypothetical protein n=1 Tax=Bacteroidaceae TaxID=815 RepID=UPI0039B68B41